MRLAKFIALFLFLTLCGTAIITKWIEPTIGETYGLLLSMIYGLLVAAHLILIYENRK